MSVRKSSVSDVTDMDDLGSLSELSAVLSVQSLDLRAQYEGKLRILTEIQREIEALRSAGATAAHQRRTLEQLEKRFVELTAANRDASDALKMIREEFDRTRQKRRRVKPASTR